MLNHTSDVVNYVVGHVVLSVLVCPGSSQCCGLCCDERCGKQPEVLCNMSVKSYHIISYESYHISYRQVTEIK